jgi:hypothetical protein
MLTLKGASLMHSRFLRWSRLVLPAIAILAVSLTASTAKAQQPPGIANELTGSWRFTLTVPAIPQLQLQALATFTSDGSFIGAMAGDGAAQPVGGFTETTAHGAWRSTSAHNFKVTFWTLNWQQPDGAFVGFFIVNMTLTFDPRTGQIIGSWIGTHKDPNLIPYDSIGGALTAHQISVE